MAQLRSSFTRPRPSPFFWSLDLDERDFWVSREAQNLRVELEATRVKLKTQGVRFRRIISVLSQQLRTKECELEASHSLRQEQLGRLLRALLNLEAGIRREQRVIRQQLTEKDSLIAQLRHQLEEQANTKKEQFDDSQTERIRATAQVLYGTKNAESGRGQGTRLYREYQHNPVLECVNRILLSDQEDASDASFQSSPEESLAECSSSHDGGSASPESTHSNQNDYETVVDPEEPVYQEVNLSESEHQEKRICLEKEIKQPVKVKPPALPPKPAQLRAIPRFAKRTSPIQRLSPEATQNIPEQAAQNVSPVTQNSHHSATNISTVTMNSHHSPTVVSSVTLNSHHSPPNVSSVTQISHHSPTNVSSVTLNCHHSPPNVSSVTLNSHTSPPTNLTNNKPSLINKSKLEDNNDMSKNNPIKPTPLPMPVKIRSDDGKIRVGCSVSSLITGDSGDSILTELRQGSQGDDDVIELEESRRDGDGASDGNASEASTAPYETFLEATGLSQKSLLTPSRLLSNHRSVVKPKDVKHRSRVLKAVAIHVASSERVPVVTKYWTEPFL